MSIEVRIPKEITEYKEKIMFGLSIRQLVCSFIALIIGVGAYYLCIIYFNSDLASYITIAIVMPVFAIGFIKKNGFTFEKYLKIMIRQKFGRSKRYYQTDLNLRVIEPNTDGEITVGKKEKKGRFKIFKKNKLRGEENVSIIKERTKYKECIGIFKITTKSSKRKSKETKSKIKRAKQEYRTVQQGVK